MPRQNLDDLKLPKGRYRIDKADATLTKFEKKALTENEDRKNRAPAMAAHAWRFASPTRKKRAAQLAKELAAPLSPDVVARGTLASSRAMRSKRIRVIGALWELSDDPRWESMRLMTIVPRGWSFAAKDLFRVDPRKLFRAFLSDLNRCGAGEADGYLIVFLHGEFEPVTRRFQLHMHGVVASGMAGVIDKLRERPKYQTARLPRDSDHDAVWRRIVMSGENPKNLVYRLGYQLKSYWTCRIIGPFGKNGKLKRARQSQRAPEPYHAAYLLWLDQWSLSDISLKVKVSVRAGRLQVSSPETYTKGGGGIG